MAKKSSGMPKKMMTKKEMSAMPAKKGGKAVKGGKKC